MRLLMLTVEPPLPATSGMRLRVLNLARQLSAIADVDVAALGAGDGASGEPFSLIALPPPPSRLVALTRAIRQPYYAARLASAAMPRLAAERRWDTVHAELPYTLPAALHAHAPVVLGAENVETHILRTLAETDTRPLHRLRWKWETRKLERFERRAVRAADAVVAPSEPDARVLREFGAPEVVVVPNGVDTAAIAYAAPQAGSTLLYVAQFGYHPNALAARELAEEILPRVRAAVPGARLKLVGREPGRRVTSLASDVVEVTGEVADVLPHLHSAQVVVVPLRAGSGTHLKVLEAMAAGTPVVSTPFGLTGLDVVPGEHVLVGETPQDLADAATRVLTDATVATRLARAARAFVEERYDWSVTALPLLDVHRRLAERP